MQSFWAKYIYFTLYINRFYNKRLWLTSNVRSLQKNLKPPFCRIDLAVARVTTTRSRFKTLRGQGWRRALASHPGVARVRFPDPASYVGWVCCWFSTLLREVFLRAGYSSFSLSLKTNISKFQFDPGMGGHFNRVLVNSWRSVGKQIHLHFCYIYIFLKIFP